MPLALWTLLWLNIRAGFRRTGRRLRSPRGILFFIVGLCVLGVSFVPSMFLNTRVRQADPQKILSTGPIAILLMCVLNLLSSAGERTVTFTAAEVDFLFPGPFSRRSLLIYKLIKTGLGVLISALIFSFLLRRYGGHFFFRFVGLWLLFQFMQLLAMLVALAQANLGERVVTTGRRWFAMVLLAVALLPLAQVYGRHHTINLAMLAESGQTSAGRVVLAPFAVFAHILVARTFFTGFVGYAAIAVAIDLAMAAIVIGMDANYLEVSATLSALRYERRARIRQSGLRGRAKPTSAGWKISMLPFAAGAGPIAWRQLTTLLRTAWRLLVITSIASVAIGITVSRLPDEKKPIGVLVGVAVYFSFFLSQMLQFDFRGDLDHFDFLRSLPLRPSAVAAAQCIAPALVLTLAHWLLLLGAGLSGHFPRSILLGAAPFAVMLNVLTIEADNLLFLLFPARLTVAVAGDMGRMGRQTIVFMSRFLILLVITGLSGGLGAVAWILSGRSWAIGAMVGAVPLIAAIAALFWFIGLAFKAFDPSVDTPA